jgi:hypothetical protein
MAPEPMRAAVRRLTPHSLPGHAVEPVAGAAGAARLLRVSGKCGLRRPWVGAVDETIERFLPVVRGERGLITHLGLEVRPSCTGTEDVHRTMRLFAEHVMPVLREEAAKAGH